MSARLVTLQGDSGTKYRVDLRGVLDDADYNAWEKARYITGDDLVYLDRRYPELMGVWATVAAGAGKILKNIGGRIFKRIAARIKARRGKSQEQAPQSQAPASVPVPEHVVQKTKLVVPDARQAQVKTVSSGDVSKMLPLIGLGAIVLIMVMKK